MKSFLLDLTIWQLFPFLLVAALIWPFTGPDGRISYLVKGNLRTLGYIRPGMRITIYEEAFDETIQKTVPRKIISSVMVTGAEWNEPNQTLKSIADYFPFLYRAPQIRLRVKGDWAVWVSVTPEEWNKLQAARRYDYPLIFD